MSLVLWTCPPGAPLAPAVSNVCCCGDLWCRGWSRLGALTVGSFKRGWKQPLCLAWSLLLPNFWEKPRPWEHCSTKKQPLFGHRARRSNRLQRWALPDSFVLLAGPHDRRNNIQRANPHPGQQNRQTRGHQRGEAAGDLRPLRTDHGKGREGAHGGARRLRRACWPGGGDAQGEDGRALTPGWASAGKRATEGPERAPHGGVHVQRAEEAGLRRGLPLAIAVH